MDGVASGEGVGGDVGLVRAGGDGRPAVAGEVSGAGEGRPGGGASNRPASGPGIRSVGDFLGRAILSR